MLDILSQLVNQLPIKWPNPASNVTLPASSVTIEPLHIPTGLNHIHEHLQRREMEGEETIVAQVERFEDYCLRERSLEGDIELALTRRDDTAVEAVELAERELKNATRECTEIKARVERARQLEFDGKRKSRLPLDSRFQVSSNGMKERRALYTTMDSDYFLDSPDPLQSTAGTDMGRKSSLSSSSHPKDDLSDEFLTLMVQRYTDICHERRMLQEEIEDCLERKEATAVEKLRYAKVDLETVRQKAVEIVAALKEASQGDFRVNLPTRSISPLGSFPIIPSGNSVNWFTSGPMATPPPLPLVTGPDPVQADEPFTPIAVSKQVPFSPSPTPLQPPLLPLGTIRSTTTDHLSQSTLRQSPTLATPSVTVPSPPSPPITPTQQAIYKQYDSMMVAAKAAGAGVSMLKIPWPILMPQAHKFPMQNVRINHLDDPIVINFFQGYIQWKGWNLNVTGSSLKTDWEHLVAQIPDHKPGGRNCVAKVLSVLRGLY